MVPEASRHRCAWANGDLLCAYHDEEWGVPVHDDRRHFEYLTLEGAQAGLSWLTVLRRREAYRRAFAAFDPSAVARYGESDIERLAQDVGLIRHRGKLASAVRNARALLAVAESFASFDAYLWHFVDGQVVQGRRTASEPPPATIPLSSAISTDLRRRGFSFVGPTIVYAHLQAAGLVQDHVAGCFRCAELGG